MELGRITKTESDFFDRKIGIDQKILRRFQFTHTPILLRTHLQIFTEQTPQSGTADGHFFNQKPQIHRLIKIVFNQFAAFFK